MIIADENKYLETQRNSMKRVRDFGKLRPKRKAFIKSLHLGYREPNREKGRNNKRQKGSETPRKQIPQINRINEFRNKGSMHKGCTGLQQMKSEN